MAGHLLPDERRDHIVGALRARGMLRVNELAGLVGVSPVTLRRDIARLAADGLVRRLHGGAALVESGLPAENAPRNTPRIGMLVPSLDYYWPEVIEGARHVATERGASLILRGTSYEGADDRTHAQHLLEAGAAGLLLAPDISSDSTSSLLGWLQGTGVPVVLVERDADTASGALPLESVRTDHIAGARAAVRHLSEEGHTRVGFVASPGSPHRDEIRRGWALAVAECGLDDGALTRELPRPHSSADSTAVAQLVHECLATQTTALLVHADREAIAIAQYCQQQGLRLPGDLSIVAYDDEVAGLFSPAMTAVRPPRTSIGRAAMALVLDRLRDPERPTHRIVIAPRLHVRNTTGPPNPSTRAH